MPSAVVRILACCASTTIRSMKPRLAESCEAAWTTDLSNFSVVKPSPIIASMLVISGEASSMDTW